MLQQFAKAKTALILENGQRKIIMLLTFYNWYNIHIHRQGASHSKLSHQYKQINNSKKHINKLHWWASSVYKRARNKSKHTAFYIQTHGTSFLKENVFTASLQYWIILNWNQGAHVVCISRLTVVSHSVCHCTTFLMQSNRN